jgi:glycerol-3-phosphate acyltransferase PlsY
MILALIILAYLSGSIPSGVWIGRMVRGIDIREHGSGNTGAANVARVVGVSWGVLVGLIDLLKGFAPVFWLGRIAAAGSNLALGDVCLILGAAAIVGHLFPVFAGFKGGKGVLTGMGVLTALLPLEVAVAAGVWGVVFAITRIVSLGSLIAASALVITVLVRRFAFHAPIADSLVVASLLLAALVFFTHRTNIHRLKEGRESRFRKS